MRSRDRRHDVHVGVNTEGTRNNLNPRMCIYQKVGTSWSFQTRAKAHLVAYCMISESRTFPNKQFIGLKWKDNSTLDFSQPCLSQDKKRFHHLALFTLQRKPCYAVISKRLGAQSSWKQIFLEILHEVTESYCLALPQKHYLWKTFNFMHVTFSSLDKWYICVWVNQTMSSANFGSLPFDWVASEASKRF